MNFCVIGLGRMGRRHLLVAKNLGFKIVGVYDPLPDSVRLAGEEYGLADEVIFSSVENMLQSTRPAALVVASTAPSHSKYVCMAAEAGVRYVLCEKPMAVSVQECDRMIAACSQSGTVLAVNHQMRFLETFTYVKQLIDSPQFGGVSSITIAGSNFGLAMNGSHYVEIFRFLTGEDISSLNFWADSEKVPNPRGAEYADRSGQLRAVSASGKRLYIEMGSDQSHGIQITFGCRFGQVMLDELTGNVRAVSRKAEFRELPSTRYGMPADESLRQIESPDVIAATEAVWRSMFDGAAFPDGASGRHSTQVLVAANVSGERGGEFVQLDDITLSERVFHWA